MYPKLLDTDNTSRLRDVEKDFTQEFLTAWNVFQIHVGRQFQAKQANLCLLVFRPAGWDNEKKIAILHENFTTVKPEDAYEDFIVKPPVRKVP